MLTKLIHFLKLRLKLENWKRDLTLVLLVLGVVLTFCWMALLAYGVTFLVEWIV